MRFLSSNNIPSSGLSIAGGHRTATDAKSSELYRNTIGIGPYLTARNSGAANVKEEDDPRTLGYMSGLYSKVIDGNHASVNVIATHSEAPAWKAFYQEIHPTSAGGATTLIDGSGDYCEFRRDASYTYPAFPYYLVYDFGLGNSETVQSYSIASVGADLKHYHIYSIREQILTGVITPLTWELQATNQQEAGKVGQGRGGEAVNDKDWVILDSQSFNVNDADWGIPRDHYGANLKSETRQWIGLVPGVNQEQVYSRAISTPGLIRFYSIDNDTAYRFFRLKIYTAEKSRGGDYGGQDTFSKCRIADFGLRGKNDSYAGLISIRNKFI